MIVANQKPVNEILGMLERYDKVLFVGCQTCVAVCLAGGEKETGVLASLVRLARQRSGRPIEVDETVVQRQCEEEFLAPLNMDGYQAVLSLGCGVGVNKLAEDSDIPILPALDTGFMGHIVEHGVWAETCAGCGECVLDRTGGICPVVRCAKSLMNGPCDGYTEDGLCETGSGDPCAWSMIYDRLKKLDMVDSLRETAPPKDWSKDRFSGPRTRVREDVRL